MDRWNRIAIVLVALLVLVGTIVTLLVAAEAVDHDFLPGGSDDQPEEAWFATELKWVDDFTGTGQTVTIVVILSVAVAMLAVLAFEFGPIVRRQPILQISSTAEGVLTIEAKSVRFLAERTGITNRNITSLHCRLGVRRRPAGGGPASIIIACYPRVILGGDLREVRDDLQTRIKETVQQLTGLTVLQVHVHRVRYDRGGTTRLVGA